MNIKVHKNTIDLIKTPINEKELNVTKCYFEFDEELVGVKKAYFTLNHGNTYMKYIVNNECDIPSEVLTNKGGLEIGVTIETIKNDEIIKRYNPSPVYMDTWVGSLKDYQNSEPITPTDKEQIERQLTEISNEMDNLDIEASKEEHTTTITITRKDGTSYDVEVLDGEKGEQGEPGVPGAVKFIIVNELPTEDIQTDAIYLVPSEEPTTQDLYLEYMYINNQWELLGQKQIVVDLTDYVKFTDYASDSKSGVIKSGYGLLINAGGNTYADIRTYANYQTVNNNLFISKGTLENVITGKGLVSNANYADDNNAGVIKSSPTYGTSVVSADGRIFADIITYSNYNNYSQYGFISKGTLENVLTARIGDIASVIDAINGESI